MTLSVRLAVMSHLTDAQTLLALGQEDSANDEINFVKKCILKWPNLDTEVETEELDKLYDSVGVEY